MIFPRPAAKGAVIPQEGLTSALERHKPRRQYARALDGDGEAHLIALACQEPPEGRSRWTLRLLADRMVRLGYVDAVSKDTVSRVLKKTNSSPGCFFRCTYH